MALIKCPECGKEISDRAASCPNCGYPIIQETSNISYEEDDFEDDDFEEDEPEMTESAVSIASLVLYVLSVIAGLLRNGLAVLFMLASFILVIVAHFQHDKKIVCATIVFWIDTIGFALTILLAALTTFLKN